jgi:VCBS repeat-containing protein
VNKPAPAKVAPIAQQAKKLSEVARRDEAEASGREHGHTAWNAKHSDGAGRDHHEHGRGNHNGHQGHRHGAQHHGEGHHHHGHHHGNGQGGSPGCTPGTPGTPVISGVVAGALSEDGAASTFSGTLTITGAPAGQASFLAQSGVAGAYGTFALSTAGVWTYVLNNAAAQVQALGEGASVSERFTVTSASGTTSTVTVTIAGSNDAPVATAVVLDAVEDTSLLAGTVAAGDVDAGSVMSFALGVAGATARVAAPAGLTFNADGSFTFDASVPAYQALGAGQSQVLNIPYTATDQFGASSAATLTITVTGTNDGPQAQAASFALREDDPLLSGNLIASDVDSGAVLSFALVNPAPPGLTLNADGSFSFNPADPAYQTLADGDSLSLSIPYIVTDERGASAGASLSITVTGVNDQAVISGVSVGALSEDSASATSSGTLSISDADAGQAHFAAQSGVQGTYGSFSLSTDGSWTYNLDNGAADVQALAEGQSVSETFDVTSADGTTRSVVITVSGSDEAPIARADLIAASEDAPLTISTTALLLNDDGIGLGVSSVQDAVGGSVALDSAGNVVFTPTANASGPASFTYTASNARGESTATVQVDVNAVADAPQLVSQAALFSLRPGSATISTPVGPPPLAAAQSTLELTLGLGVNQLDSFAPPAGTAPVTTNDPGTVDVSGGSSTSYTLSLAAGNVASFAWQFFNAETSAGFINLGYNDVAALFVTDPSGTRVPVQLSSSEQTGPNVNGAAVDAAGTYQFTATAAGEYRFDWLVLNGFSFAGPSSLNVASPTITIGANTYGQPVNLAISVGLADSDGSEALGSISVSGVPAGAALSSGTDLGGGVWSLTPTQLSGLQFLPTVGFNGTVNLTVSATSTELSNGATATQTQVVALTFESTTTALMGTQNADNITGTAGNDHSQGFGGNDVLSGNDGNDLLYGAAGTDSLNGGNGHDALYGGVDADTLNAGAGNDKLHGGAGSDIMTGGLGSDVFAWVFADRGTAGTPAIDSIADFNFAGPAAAGDIIDLRDLLQGESKAGFGAGTLERFLDFDTNSVAGSTIIRVSSSGGFAGGVYSAAAEDQRIVLAGVDMRSAGAFGLDAGASDNDIIHQLLQRGSLIADGP